ncbi:hypothetical protein KI387_028157, partial [Taxus chinensis]
GGHMTIITIPICTLGYIGPKDWPPVHANWPPPPLNLANCPYTIPNWVIRVTTCPYRVSLRTVIVAKSGLPRFGWYYSVNEPPTIVYIYLSLWHHRSACLPPARPALWCTIGYGR